MENWGLILVCYSRKENFLSCPRKLFSPRVSLASMHLNHVRKTSLLTIRYSQINQRSTAISEHSVTGCSSWLTIHSKTTHRQPAQNFSGHRSYSKSTSVSNSALLGQSSRRPAIIISSLKMYGFFLYVSCPEIGEGIWRKVGTTTCALRDRLDKAKAPVTIREILADSEHTWSSFMQYRCCILCLLYWLLANVKRRHYRLSLGIAS